jgi:hypothetical protein
MVGTTGVLGVTDSSDLCGRPLVTVALGTIMIAPPKAA